MVVICQLGTANHVAALAAAQSAYFLAQAEGALA
jgi:hypothetical protein